MPDPDLWQAPNHTLDAVASWLNTTAADPKFANHVEKARDLAMMNLDSTAERVLPPKSSKNCAAADKAAGITANAWTGPAIGVNLCDTAYEASDECRRVVMIHEFFHTKKAQLIDVDTNTKFNSPNPKTSQKRTTEIALTDAAYMAGLVSQIYSGMEDSCP